MKAWCRPLLIAGLISNWMPSVALAGGETGSLETDPSHPSQGDGVVVMPGQGEFDKGWAIIVSHDQYRRLVVRLSYLNEAIIPGTDGVKAKKVGSVVWTKDNKKQVIPVIYESK
jgi:hypothetical protein